MRGKKGFRASGLLKNIHNGLLLLLKSRDIHETKPIPLPNFTRIQGMDGAHLPSVPIILPWAPTPSIHVSSIDRR